MSVDEDYPVEIQQRRHNLQPILKTAVKIDKYKGKAKLKYDKLILDGIELKTLIICQITY